MFIFGGIKPTVTGDSGDQVMMDKVQSKQIVSSNYGRTDVTSTGTWQQLHISQLAAVSFHGHAQMGIQKVKQVPSVSGCMLELC